MATVYQFSALLSGASIVFNPEEDELRFDDLLTTPSSLAFAEAGGNLQLSLNGKTITMTGISLVNLTPANITFLNGSAFLVGDGLASAVGDAAGNSIIGTGGDDVLYGLGGNDTLNGGAGSDVLVGGSGNDLYFVDSYGDTVIEATSEGLDTVITTINYGLPANVETLIMAGSDNLSAAGNGNDNIISGNSGNNELDGSAGADILAGGPGDDIYHVDHIGDQVMELGGSGIDFVISTVNYNLMQAWHVENLILSGSVDLTGRGNWLNNQINGSSGNDWIDGDRGNDFLMGGLGNDQLFGGSGDDTLEGGADNDTLSGGSGDDTLIGGEGNDSLVGGDGIDTLIYSGAGSGVTVNLAAGAVTGGAGTDTVVGVENVIGSSYADYIEGTAGANRLDGGAGVNTVGYTAAGAGVTVNLGTGVASGGGGDDTLIGFSSVEGSQYGDVLIGNSSANSLYGNGGNDTLYGGGGGETDLLSGGAGYDTVDYSAVGTNIVIYMGPSSGSAGGLGFSQTLLGIDEAIGTDYGDELYAYDLTAVRLIGGGGNDTIKGIFSDGDTLEGGAGTDWLDLSDDENVFVDLENETASDAGSLRVYGVTGIEHVLGTSGGDLMIGDAEANRLMGEGGNDTLSGGSGDDTLIGGEGNDSLVGGPGADLLIGGAGADVLVYDTVDSLIAGGDSVDTLQIIGNGVTLNLASIAGSLITDIEVIDITGDGNNTLTLAFADVLDISSSTDALRVVGNSGDTVNVGSGWSSAGTLPFNGKNYALYSQLTASLLIDTDIVVNPA